MLRIVVLAVVMLVPLVREVLADDTDGPWTPKRHVALVAELRGGLLLLDPPDEGVGGGVLGGLSFRGNVDSFVDERFGVAFAGDFEAGFAGPGLQGQARLGGGLGVLLGPVSTSVLAGGSLGSIGPGGSSDLFVEANASFTVDRRVGVWLQAARAFSKDLGHDRLELRVALPKWSDGSGASTIIGLRMLVFEAAPMATERAVAYLVTVGWGTIQSEPGYIDPRFF